MWRSALVLVVLLAACGGEDSSSALCELGDGRVYKPGDVFPAGDGCNTCQCGGPGVEPGLYACTLIGCQDAGPAGECEPAPSSACSVGPACGDGCCGQGERCVDGACMCGDAAACATGEICGASEPLTGTGCGVVCCPPEGPCT